VSTFDGKCKGTFLQKTDKTSSATISNSLENDPSSNETETVLNQIKLRLTTISNQ